MARMLSAWLQRVVPLRADAMWCQPKTSHFVVGDSFAQFVAATLERCSDRQSGACRCIRDIVGYQLEAAQGFSRPIEADVTEQSMFDRIPLRATARVMANGHRQTAGIA